MKNLFKKLSCITLSLMLVLSIVSCGKEEVKVTFEMPYTTSAEPVMEETCKTVVDALGVDIEYAYADNTATFTMNESDVAKTLESLQKEKDKFLEQYKTDGLVNEITINDNYTELTIDFKSTTGPTDVEAVYTEFLGLAMSYQCFTGVAANEFLLNATLLVDGQEVMVQEINQELMIQS